jgi:outer membrane protein assembly factor BamB
MRFHKAAASLMLGVLLMSGGVHAADNWPQFRGPTGDGISDSKGLPTTWGANEHVKWKVDIHGKSWSSPVIFGDQVWVTAATADGKELSVLTIDRESGKIIRDQKLFDIEKPQYCIPFNSYASCTPAIEEGRIYVTFGSPGTACLDTKNGQILWTRTDFVCNHFRAPGSSPLIYNDMLIMNYDGSDHQFIVALDKHDGHTLWRTERDINFNDVNADGKPRGDGDFRKAFSTPRVLTINGHDQIISLGSKSIYSYSPADGHELWKIGFKDSHSGSDTPVITDGMIFFGNGHGGSEMVAIRPDPSGIVTESNIVWRTHKRVPTRSSALVVDGMLYMTTDAGIVTCLDAKSGDEIWHDRIDGQYSASPLYADGKIYFFAEDGIATVITAGRKFEVLAKNNLADGSPVIPELQGPSSGFMGTPAIAGKAFYLRTRTSLYRVEN